MVKTRKQIEVEEKEVIRRERCACGHSDFIFISIIFWSGEKHFNRFSTRELVSTVRLPAEAEAFVTSTIAAGKKRRTLSNAQVNFYTLASSCLNQF